MTDAYWRPGTSQRIAFQGELGAFGHDAVALVDAGAKPIPVPTFDGVIAAVRRGDASIGVLPVENVIVGAVQQSIAALREAHDAVLVDEVTVPVRLCLLGVRGATIETITEVHSQDVALAQCNEFFARRASLARVRAHDTAGAARYVARTNDVRIAAIASERAARQYSLDILAAGIEDRPGNATRFAVFTLRA
jgi:prephenate dehydratase